MSMLNQARSFLKALIGCLLALSLHGHANAVEGCWSVYVSGCPGCGRATGFRAQTISPGNCYWCPGWCAIFLTGYIADTSDPNVTVKDGVVYVGASPSAPAGGQRLDIADGLLTSLSQVNPMAATVLLMLKRHPDLANFHIVSGKMVHNGKLTGSTFSLHLQGSSQEQAILDSATPPGRPGHMAETVWSSSRQGADRLQVVFRAHEIDESGVVVKPYFPSIALDVVATGARSAQVIGWSMLP